MIQNTTTNTNTNTKPNPKPKAKANSKTKKENCWLNEYKYKNTSIPQPNNKSFTHHPRLREGKIASAASVCKEMGVQPIVPDEHIPADSDRNPAIHAFKTLPNLNTHHHSITSSSFITNTIASHHQIHSKSLSLNTSAQIQLPHSSNDFRQTQGSVSQHARNCAPAYSASANSAGNKENNYCLDFTKNQTQQNMPSVHQKSLSTFSNSIHKNQKKNNFVFQTEGEIDLAHEDLENYLSSDFSTLSDEKHIHENSAHPSCILPDSNGPGYQDLNLKKLSFSYGTSSNPSNYVMKTPFKDSKFILNFNQ